MHGAHVGAWCWAEHFLGWFAARGFPVLAVSLRGHGASGGRERLNLFGLADYARDVEATADTLARAPVLIGHSMGALVALKALERGGGRIGAPGAPPALVLACPVPAFGTLPSTWSLALTRPALLAEINAAAAGGCASLETLAETLFSAELERERLGRYLARMFAVSRSAGNTRKPTSTRLSSHFTPSIHPHDFLKTHTFVAELQVIRRMCPIPVVPSA